MKKKKILLTQRLDCVGKFHEKRDNLDIRFIKFVLDLKMDVTIIPNNLRYLKSFLSKKNIIDGIILTPGGDPKIKDERAFVEEKLIKYAILKNIPLIGICRGAQKINLFFGGKMKKVKNHVRKKHKILGKITRNKNNILVNSYHDYGITRSTLSNKFDILAYTQDGIIESFIHKKKKIFGIMWHPERYKNIKYFDLNIFKNFF